MADAVLLFAFDPVDELGGRDGVLEVEPALAETLVAQHRAERIEEHATLSQRYVRGSAAHAAARDALRAARNETVSVTEVQPAPRKTRTPTARKR